MITIRQEAAADTTAVFEVNRRAFKQDNEPRLVDALRSSSAFIPELSLVAVGDETGIIVGYILFTHLGFVPDNPGQDLSTGANDPIKLLSLAPMAVLPEYQRQGIGGRLIRSGIETARKMGFHGIVVLGHPEYYPSFGFSPARARGINPPLDWPDEAFLAMELVPGAFEDIHGTVMYDPAFDNV